MFHLVGIFRTSGPGGSISSSPERTALRRQARGVLQRRAGSLIVKRCLWIKENQTSQVKECIAFLCMGRCKNLGHWNHSFYMYTSAIWGQFPLFSCPEFSGLTVWSGCGLMAARWLVFFPSWVPSGLICSSSMVATIADDCDIICLLIWQEVFHSAPHRVAMRINWDELYKMLAPEPGPNSMKTLLNSSYNYTSMLVDIFPWGCISMICIWFLKDQKYPFRSKTKVKQYCW